MIYDVIIVGAGIIGSSIARKLSSYELSVAVLEKSNDVCNKTSAANSAIIHSGYDPLPGTLKAKFNVLGNKMFDQIAKDLDIEFLRIGSLTVAMNDEQLKTLEELHERSKINGVETILLNKEQTIKEEPNINPEVKGSLLAPTAGIIDPFTLCIRSMENAVDNGVGLFLSNEVIDIKYFDGQYTIKTNKDTYVSKVVINCAGLASDKIASLIEDIDWKIEPRKGQYFLLDHFQWAFAKHTIFPLPSNKGKGVLFSMTTSGNYIVGPSSEPVDDINDVSTDAETLQNIKKQAIELVPSIPFDQTIRTFAGNRASCSKHDFIIEPSKKYKSFINVAGIESPGIVSSPAIAEYVVNDLISNLVILKKKDSYNPCVKKRHRYFKMLITNDFSYIKDHPEYADIICSCEKVSLGEIQDELYSSIPPRSIRGLKKRTRAGFGKCQNGFCQAKELLLLAKRWNVSPSEIPLDEEGSYILDTED